MPRKRQTRARRVRVASSRKKRNTMKVSRRARSRSRKNTRKAARRKNTRRRRSRQRGSSGPPATSGLQRLSRPVVEVPSRPIAFWQEQQEVLKEAGSWTGPIVLDWTCPACKNKNRGTAVECESGGCNADKPNDGREPAKPMEGLGRGMAQWQGSDTGRRQGNALGSAYRTCGLCNTNYPTLPFTTKVVAKYKHHCRRCGESVCNNCSKYELYLKGYLHEDKPHLYIDEISDTAQRVCKQCVQNVADGNVRSSAEVAQSASASARYSYSSPVPPVGGGGRAASRSPPPSWEPQPEPGQPASLTSLAGLLPRDSTSSRSMSSPGSSPRAVSPDSSGSSSLDPGLVSGESL
jgi:hypothetical protein